MLNCKQATELTSQPEAMPLPLGRRVALRLHLMICNRCRRYAQQLNFIQQVSARLQAKTEHSNEGLSEASKQRIAEKINRAQASK